MFELLPEEDDELLLLLLLLVLLAVEEVLWLVDCVLVAAFAAGVEPSSYPITIGLCPETLRSSQAEFYEVRIYSKALTASEIASQNTNSPAYAPDSKYVKLWLDFDNLAEGSLSGDINADGNVNIADLLLLQKYLLNNTKFTSAQYIAADMDSDGKVNGFDMVLLRQTLLEKKL